MRPLWGSEVQIAPTAKTINLYLFYIKDGKNQGLFALILIAMHCRRPLEAKQFLNVN
jgi:hypothetical protein